MPLQIKNLYPKKGQIIKLSFTAPVKDFEGLEQ